jgi:hypothetical protein
MTKLTVAFRNFANATKKCKSLHLPRNILHMLIGRYRGFAAISYRVIISFMFGLIKTYHQLCIKFSMLMYSNHVRIKENIATPHLSYVMIVLSSPNYHQIIPYFANELQPVTLLSFSFDTVQKLLEFHRKSEV